MCIIFKETLHNDLVATLDGKDFLRFDMIRRKEIFTVIEMENMDFCPGI